MKDAVTEFGGSPEDLKVWDEIRDKTLAIMARRNIIGVVSGPYKRVMAWRALAPDRVLPALMPFLKADGHQEPQADPTEQLAQ